MAVANTKSNNITNADASPIVKNSPSIDGGNLKVKVATLAVAAADDDGSVYRFVRVPSNAVVTKIDLLNDAITSGTDYDLGIYQTADNGGAVANVNAWADAVDLSSARVTPLDVTHEAGSDCPIEYAERKVWQLAGASADTGIEYDICLTGVTVGSGAGDITLKVYYSV